MQMVDVIVKIQSIVQVSVLISIKKNPVCVGLIHCLYIEFLHVVRTRISLKNGIFTQKSLHGAVNVTSASASVMFLMSRPVGVVATYCQIMSLTPSGRPAAVMQSSISHTGPKPGGTCKNVIARLRLTRWTTRKVGQTRKTMTEMVWGGTVSCIASGSASSSSSSGSFSRFSPPFVDATACTTHDTCCHRA